MSADTKKKATAPGHAREQNPVRYVVRQQQRVAQLIARQAAHSMRRLNAALARHGL